MTPSNRLYDLGEHAMGSEVEPIPKMIFTGSDGQQIDLVGVYFDKFYDSLK